jgi:hypothetical protein
MRDLNLTHSDTPTRVNDLFDADLVLYQTTQRERENANITDSI